MSEFIVIICVCYQVHSLKMDFRLHQAALASGVLAAVLIMVFFGDGLISVGSFRNNHKKFVLRFSFVC